MDVFFVSVTPEDEFQLGGSDEFANDVDDVVADNAFSGGEVADGHFDDPAIDVGDVGGGAPLFDVFLHCDFFGLPVVGLHRFVEVVGPLVFEREDVEKHRLFAVDDFFGSEGFFGFCFVENKGAVAEFDFCCGHGWRSCKI